MADTKAPANLYSWLTSLSPAVIAVATALTAFIAGGATAWVAKPEPAKIAVPAADPPKPTPVVSVVGVTDLIKTHCTEVQWKLDRLLERTEPKTPAPPKKTKAAAR